MNKNLKKIKNRLIIYGIVLSGALAINSCNDKEYTNESNKEKRINYGKEFNTSSYGCRNGK